MTTRVLLISPPATRRTYLETNVSVGAPVLPTLGLATIAGALTADNHEVRILDLDLIDVSGGSTDAALAETLIDFKPEFVGLTSITPTWHSMMDIASAVKGFNSAIKVISGGVHPTIFPEETLATGVVDYVAIGENDFAMNRLLAGDAPETIPGLAFRENNKASNTSAPEEIIEPDSLPYPAWELFEKERYRMSHLTERHRPGGYMETSRGCPFNCIYCSKATFGKKFRGKSPERVVNEVDIMINKHGFRELHIVDDGFTNDIDRAKTICELIISKKLTVPFNLFNGIRADRIDDELCSLMKKAGCYQVAFGVESGNDHVLKGVSKGLNKDTIRKAVKMVKKSGMETYGFFVIALPEDTEKTINDTIAFAVELDMTISKFDISVPLPGTKMYRQIDEAGRIKTKDWSQYIFHRTDTHLFDHPNMSWEKIEELYKLAYRKSYLRAGYIAKRFIHGIRTGGLWHDASSFLKSSW